MPFDRISVGHVEVFALLDGVREVETHITEAFPGSPPDELLSYRSLYPGIYGEGNCWRIAIRAWLIRYAGGQILVDTGIGQATAPRRRMVRCHGGASYGTLGGRNGGGRHR